MIQLLFPADTQLVVETVEIQSKRIDIFAQRCTQEESCPDCHCHQSAKIHSMYRRHPHDLPCLGHAVQLHLRVRRFFCPNQACPRRTFAELFCQLLRFKARRTQRLRQQHLAIAHATSGEAGRRLLPFLAMLISGDTLIRDILAVAVERAATPRVLGIDDWAKKRGRTYGTILVNLETNQPVDLLDSREVEVVAAWLKEHPGAEIISRDRGLNYIKATTDGAPKAEQVADRWHLLKDLREALETMLGGKPAALAAAGQRENSQHGGAQEAATASRPEEVVPIKGPDEAKSLPRLIEKPMTKAERAQMAGHARRQARFECVNQLLDEGHSIRAISQKLGLARRTVSKYVEAEICPQYTVGRPYPSKLTPWLPYLEERWQTGYTNATQLWREIVALGFSGSRGLVSRWTAGVRKLLPADSQFSRKQPKEVKPTLTKETACIPWSSSRASWILVREHKLLDEQEKAALARMMAADSQVGVAAELAQRFVAMLKQKAVDQLASWLRDAVASGIHSFISLANGLLQDIGAVRNAITMKWSTGPVEGNINKLKFIKRITYGRANFDLLRQRVLYRPVTS